MAEDTYEKGKALSEQLNPGMEDTLKARYDDLVPGLSKSVVDFAYGQHYGRDGVDLKTRYLATIAALTALGGQTAPQLKVNIQGARKAGASAREVGEIIWQMALYGGFPAAINALNVALNVFENEHKEK